MTTRSMLVSVSLFVLVLIFPFSKSMAGGIVVAASDGANMRIDAYTLSAVGIHLDSELVYACPGIAGAIATVQRNHNELDVFYPTTVNPPPTTPKFKMREDRIHLLYTPQNNIGNFDFISRTTFQAFLDEFPWILAAAFKSNPTPSQTPLSLMAAYSRFFGTKNLSPITFAPFGPIHSVFAIPSGFFPVAGSLSPQGEFGAVSVFDPNSGYFVGLFNLKNGLPQGTPRVYHVTGSPISLDCSPILPNDKIFLADEELRRLQNGVPQIRPELIQFNSNFDVSGNPIFLGPFTSVSDANAGFAEYELMKILAFPNEANPFLMALFPKQNPAGQLQIFDRRLDLNGHPTGPSHPLPFLTTFPIKYMGATTVNSFPQ